MKYYDWDSGKNERLIAEREIGFEDILVAIDEGGLLDILAHPNKARHPDQKLFVVVVGDYIYLVPFAEDEEKIFLKTIIPSRKATKKYLKSKKQS